MIRNIKRKNIRRFMLFLSLIFPVVYLCGGLFFGLAGAHGEQMFAEPVYTEGYVNTNLMNPDVSKIETNESDSTPLFDSIMRRTDFPYITSNFTINNVSYIKITYGQWTSTTKILLLQKTDNSYVNVATFENDILTISQPFQSYLIILGNYDLLNFWYSYLPSFFNLYKISLIPTNVVAENNSAYTDFIFSQPFAKDNFISSLGRDLVNGSTKGFAPVGQLFRYINDNVMHFEVTDLLAMFGFGYVYYVFNVLIIYEVIVLVAWLLLIPIKVMDGFHKEDNRYDS